MDDETRRSIMCGTYRALCEHGYAALTMQDIADETDKSKATLHYHYERKHDLLVAFLEYLFEQFTAQVADPAGDDAVTRLESFIDDVLVPPESTVDEHVAFRTALLELKAQAPYDEAIRERLVLFDEFLFEQVQKQIVLGIEAGTFRSVDPDDTARFIVTALDGAGTKQVAVGQEINCTRRMLRSYIETQLVVDGSGSDRDSEHNNQNQTQHRQPEVGVE